MSVVKVIIPDNYSTLQAALNSKPEEEFWDIFVKAGLHIAPYVSGSPAIALKPNVRIHGQPSGVLLTADPATWSPTVLMRTPGSTYHLMGVKSGVAIRNFTLEDITLEGNLDTTTTLPLNGQGDCIGFDGSVSGNSPIHSGITLRRVAGRRSGAIIGGRNVIGMSWSDFGALIEDCFAELCWTNLVFTNGAYITIRRNLFQKTAQTRAGGTGGDSIFPRCDSTYPSSLTAPGTTGVCHDWIIEDNTLFDIGDTGFDPTVPAAQPYNVSDMIFQRNMMINAWIRSSKSQNIQVLNNVFYDDPAGTFNKAGIGFDSGQARPRDITILGNKITSYGRNCVNVVGEGTTVVKGNDLTQLDATKNVLSIPCIGSVQAEDNIMNGGLYGVDFANWGIGGGLTSLSFRRNHIKNFSTYGVYDDGKGQGSVSGVIIDDNSIYSPAAAWAVYGAASKWTVTNNRLTVGAKTGNGAVSALAGSIISGNIPYTPLTRKLTLKGPAGLPWTVNGQLLTGNQVITLPDGTTVTISVPPLVVV